MRTYSIGIVIAVILLIAAAIGGIVVLLYRKRMNRALIEEQSTAHTSLPAPADTLGGIYKLVMLGLIIWVCISMGKLSSIQQEIENLKSLSAGNSNSISFELENFKSEMLKANSRVGSYTSTCNDLNTSDNTCMVKHTVRLKSFSDNTEVVFVSVDGQEVKMDKTGEGRYEAIIKTDLFKTYDGEFGITIKENGVNYYEALEDERFYGTEPAYWQQYIPYINGEFGTDVTYLNNDVNIRNIVVDSMYKSEYNISSAKVVVEKNGSVIDTIDAKDSFAIPYGPIEIPVQKDYEVTEKDNMNATLILTTEEGYTLEQLLYEKTGTMNRTYGNSFIITDNSGNVVLSR